MAKKRHRRTLVEIGRDLQVEQNEEAVEAVSEFTIGQPVQYYDKGWRFGHVAEIPSRGLRRGMIQIHHAITGNVWVQGTNVKAIETGE